MKKRDLNLGSAAKRIWRQLFMKPGSSTPSPHPHDFTIRVLRSDLYDPKKNLIEHVIWDEEELGENEFQRP